MARPRFNGFRGWALAFMKLYHHRDCYGLQLLRLWSWTFTVWYVPITTKLLPHTHPDQHVIIIVLFGLRTTFNRIRPGIADSLVTRNAWPGSVHVTPNGWAHFANKGSDGKPRRGPFIYLSIIKWLDGKPKHPRDGFEIVEV